VERQRSAVARRYTDATKKGLRLRGFGVLPPLQEKRTKYGGTYFEVVPCLAWGERSEVLGYPAHARTVRTNECTLLALGQSLASAEGVTVGKSNARKREGAFH